MLRHQLSIWYRKSHLVMLTMGCQFPFVSSLAVPAFVQVWSSHEVAVASRQQEPPHSSRTELLHCTVSQVRHNARSPQPPLATRSPSLQIMVDCSPQTPRRGHTPDAHASGERETRGRPREDIAIGCVYQAAEHFSPCALEWDAS